MDIQPIDTGILMSKVAEEGPLFAFMFFCFILALLAIRTLYNRNVKQGEDQNKAQVDGITALSSNTHSLNAIGDRLEESARRDEKILETLQGLVRTVDILTEKVRP